MPSKITRKNLLDLHFSKNLQYFNTSLILLFTFLIGIIIGFITNQISYGNSGQLLIVGISSTIIISMLVVFIHKFRERMKRILKEVRNLD